MFGIGKKVSIATATETISPNVTTGEIQETGKTITPPTSREVLSRLSNLETKKSNADQPQAKEPSFGVPFKEAPKSLQKALYFLPEEVKKELNFFQVGENRYQASFNGETSQKFFLGGIKGAIHAMNPFKSLIPDQASELLKQSERAKDLMPLLKQDKVHMQALFELNEKTTKLIDLSLTDSPYGLLKDVISGKNPAMKKLLTEILDQILPEANVKNKKDETTEINLSEGDKPAFLALQEALKEKKSEAALAKAKPVIDSMARTYGLETLKDTDEIRLDKALEISINTLIDKNRHREGGNTTIFAKGHSSEEFAAPKLEINGLIPMQGKFKPGIMTVINDHPDINLPLGTLLTTLEMAHFTNNGKFKELQPELIKAAIENTKNAAAISAESQAKATAAHLN